MKNKDKYDLRKLIFMWQYKSYYDVFGVSIIYENKYIDEISCDRNSPLIAIMNWLEMDEEIRRTLQEYSEMNRKKSQE